MAPPGTYASRVVLHRYRSGLEQHLVALLPACPASSLPHWADLGAGRHKMRSRRLSTWWRSLATWGSSPMPSRSGSHHCTHTKHHIIPVLRCCITVTVSTAKQLSTHRSHSAVKQPYEAAVKVLKQDLLHGPFSYLPWLHSLLCHISLKPPADPLRQLSGSESQFARISLF